MPWLKLNRITCHKQEDWTGDDDPYIKVNGRHVWGPRSMDTGQTREIHHQVPFSRRASVALYERDVWDGDDHLGTHTITRQHIGIGEQAYSFAEDGANYTIWIEATN